MGPDWMPSLLFGALVGFSLGLTGGGGSIFAVPLLIYGLKTGVREAVGISLAAVGATALFGVLTRIRHREVEWLTGLLFALAGVIGAPFGTWIGAKLPEALTLISFAVLMAVVGVRMWRGSPETRLSERENACERDDSGRLLLNTRCALMLGFAGLLAGVLSGIFGVGGGFIIVPSLILATGMPIHRAVSTSLLVIGLICISAIVSYAWTGPAIPIALTNTFVVGGFAGMLGGNALRGLMPTKVLNRVFATGMWAVAGWLIWRNVG